MTTPKPQDDNIFKFSACQRHGHRYEPVSAPYHKVTGERRRFPPFGMKRDRTVRYLMLMCTQCGDTKEIIHRDRRFSLAQCKSI
jgi:hypothetical protein